MKRKLNVSGYRGIWGDTLTDNIVIKYTRAFAKFTKETSKNNNPSILIGRDGRQTGSHIRDIIVNELINLNINVIDGDILPTPTILFSINKHRYDGGIIITASHNPVEYNGLKFVNKKGLFTIEKEVEQIEKYYKDEISEINNDAKLRNADTSLNPNFVKEHVDKIISHINIEIIRKQKWRIAVDMINASACVIDPYLFEKLGVELIPLNNTPTGIFAHKPEPLKENLEDIGKLVLESKANLGFVHDPDADRLVVVNENGNIISEEYTIALAIKNIVSKNQGSPIVLNLSTSQRGVDIAKKYGSECFKTKIGEGYVVTGISKHNAIIGGEGNGGVIYPTINTARDSFVGIALILELLAENNQTISQIIDTLPKYFIKKDKWPVGDNLNQIYSKLKSHFKKAKIDEQDGIRFDFDDDSWIHLRPSNTEPIVRLFGEAKNQTRIDSLFEEVNIIINNK